MKKLFSLFLLALLLPVVVVAEPVDKDAARQKAEAFFTKQSPSSARRARVQQDIRLVLTNENYHVFNLGTKDGFVIISGDDCTDEILGYADSGSFDAENMPENLRAWLQSYAEQIAWMKANNITNESSPLGGTRGGGRAKVAPLLTSKWGQGAPYSRQTPGVTGCVATAMAQVMYYWYQKEGYETNLVNDIPEYEPQWYPALESLSAPATFDWAHMTDEYDDNSTDTEGDAVAKLMKYVGYSVEMDYGTSSSSAPSQNIAPALKDNFGYKSARFFAASQYSYEDLQTVIYTDLAAGRPVLYCGFSTDGGHEFVCDGYDKDDYFHFNWGWRGDSNGYYKLALCNPPWQGIGGSSTNGAFYMNQDAVCGIHPTQTVSLPIEPMECAPENAIFLKSIDIPTLYKGETADITLTLINLDATRTFNGNVCFRYDKGVKLGGTIVNIPPQSSREYNVSVCIPYYCSYEFNFTVWVYDILTDNEMTMIASREVGVRRYAPYLEGTVKIKEDYAEVGSPLSFELSGDVASLPASTIHPQWQIKNRNEWEDIAGATGSSYTPTLEDGGKDVRVAIKADGYPRKVTSEGKQVQRPKLTGVVTLIHDTYPSPGTQLSYQLEGAVADIDPSLLQVKWQARADEKNAFRDIPDETGQYYTLKAADVGKWFRARIISDYYSGLVQSNERLQCVKAPNTQNPVAPTLENSAYYNQIVVTNPQEGQEYIIVEHKNYFNGLTESDWAAAKTPEPGNSVLRMGGSVNNVNYVYTRMKETETTLAGTEIQRASIYFGENIYVQDFDLTINKALSASSTEPLEQENGCFYTQMDDVLRLDVTPIPANATNFNGIFYDNWLDDAHNGTFYADYACTQPLQSGQSYMTVFYKPGKAENYVHVGAQYTLGYNWLAYNVYTLHIGSRIPRWYANSISATIDVNKGERVWDFPYELTPGKASLHGLSFELREGTGTAPELEFVVERGVINVDARNATKGSYIFDIYQNGERLQGSVRVNVVTPALEEIVLQPSRLELDRGQELKLSLELYPAGAEEDITWDSSDKSVATVTADGVVRVAANADIGQTTTITVTAGDLSASCELTVPGEKYPLYLAGTQVTTRNKDRLCDVAANLSEEAMERWMSGEMEITYDGEVLRLKNAIINADRTNAPGLVLGKYGTTVVVEGDCSISSTSGIGMKIAKTANIVGDGSLNIVGNEAAILLDSDSGNDYIRLVASDVNLSLTGTQHAIKGSEGDLCSVELSNVAALGQGNSGVISGLSGGLALENCYIQDPKGAELMNGSLWNGSTLADYFRIVRGEDPDGIGGLTPDPSPVGEGSIYNLIGQRLSRMQKGINIVNGKKVMVK